ncbi:MAG: hypothetical protein NTV49_15265 [Kiritimatiellaeota bacterium]|nr:hypothetical protein [Kiritimatiellota bacterium]
MRAATGLTDPDLGAALGNDLVKTCVGLELSFYGQPYPEYTDAWGIRWRYVRNTFGVFTEIAEHPLAGDPAKLGTFTIPDPLADAQYDTFRKMKTLYGREKWLIGSSQISIFEAAWYLRGLEQFMMDLALEPDYAGALMDKVMQFPLGAARQHAALGADMIWFGDDISGQQGMTLSPTMWRAFLKPRYAALFAATKQAKPDVKIAYHSCGNCAAILDDLVELGLDVLNPLQPLAINPFEIKKRYGQRLALFGGLCVQHVMPYGTPEEVRAAVHRLKTECGTGGGYILAPAHHIQADTPLANIRAFYEEGLRTNWN